MRLRAVLALALAALALVSCKRCGGASADAAPDAASGDAASAATETPRDAGAPEDATTEALLDEPFGDAGTSSCRLVYGPAEQPFRGPAELSASGHELRLVANDGGRPRTFTLAIPPAPPRGAPPFVPHRPAGFVGMRWPPCELAGRYAYCEAAGGVVQRTLADGTGPTRRVATGRPGTRLAAAALGERAVLAYLDSRHTTEGEMLQAFAVLDEGTPVRLSDEGAGATSVRLLDRGGSISAVYIDTRTSMVPVHARTLSVEDGELKLGPDAVVFVGGAPERGIELSATTAGAKAFALLPMPRDVLDFGLAVLPIERAPRDEVSAVWSAYPNGLDPAPVAAAPARSGEGAWVARVRPREKAVGSPRILELGRLDGAGAFTSLGEVAPGPRNDLHVTDIDLLEDGAGGVWILYGDSTRTWLERRLCP